MDDLIAALKEVATTVHKPGEREYERSVATENLLYRFSRPACVVQPKNASQVQSIVKEAKEKNIRITIKNGGHSYMGASTANGGILLDLMKMDKVKLDMTPGSETVTLGGGAKWGHAYKELVNGGHDGYVVNGGRCPTVGVSGFILGGGLSPFTRSFGMGCDTLKEATIVTADGNKVTVKASDDRNSDRGRLFWALCGAGGGNFGVVVELKMAVQKLSSKDVVAGRFTWFPKPKPTDKSDFMATFMAAMNSFYTAKWPDETTIDSSWLCDLSETKSELAVRFLVYHNGNKAGFHKVVDDCVKHEELAKQLKQRSSSETSSRFLHETLVAQWSEEIKMAIPSLDRSYSIYTSFVLVNDDATVAAITSIIRKEMEAFREQFTGEQGLLQVTWIHSGGEASKKTRTATAFPWRTCVYHTYVMLQWKEKWLGEDMKDFLKRMETKLRPFSIEKRAVFVNFPDAELPQSAYEAAYYGDNHQELQQVKKIWDKDDFFRWTQGVRLPKTTTEGPGELHVVMSEMQVASIAASVVEEPLNEVEDELEVAEDELPDTIDGQTWEILSLKNDFEGGIYSLADLGF